MYFRKLGSTGCLTGEIGFAAWPGNRRTVPDEPTATSMIRYALDRGVGFLDVTPRDDGYMEQVVGRAIAGRREQVLIASHATTDNAGSLERRVRTSIEHLRCEYLDLLQLGYPADETDGSDLLPRVGPTLLDEVDRLCEAGVVRHVGVVVDSLEAGLAALQDRRISTLQLTLSAADAELLQLLAAARAAGRGLIVRSPLCGGLLAASEPSDWEFRDGDPRRDWPDARRESGRAVGQRLGAMVAGTDRSPAQAAIGWVLAHEAVSVVLPVATTLQQLAENLAASDLPLPAPRLLAAVQHARLTAVPA